MTSVGSSYHDRFTDISTSGALEGTAGTIKFKLEFKKGQWLIQRDGIDKNFEVFSIKVPDGCGGIRDYFEVLADNCRESGEELRAKLLDTASKAVKLFEEAAAMRTTEKRTGTISAQFTGEVGRETFNATHIKGNVGVTEWESDVADENQLSQGMLIVKRAVEDIFKSLNIRSSTARSDAHDHGDSGIQVQGSGLPNATPKILRQLPDPEDDNATERPTGAATGTGNTDTNAPTDDVTGTGNTDTNAPTRDVTVGIGDENNNSEVMSIISDSDKSLYSALSGSLGGDVTLDTGADNTTTVGGGTHSVPSQDFPQLPETQGAGKISLDTAKSSSEDLIKKLENKSTTTRFQWAQDVSKWAQKVQGTESLEIFKNPDGISLLHNFWTPSNPLDSDVGSGDTEKSLSYVYMLGYNLASLDELAGVLNNKHFWYFFQIAQLRSIYELVTEKCEDPSLSSQAKNELEKVRDSFKKYYQEDPKAIPDDFCVTANRFVANAQEERQLSEPSAIAKAFIRHMNELNENLSGVHGGTNRKVNEILREYIDKDTFKNKLQEKLLEIFPHTESH